MKIVITILFFTLTLMSNDLSMKQIKENSNFTYGKGIKEVLVFITPGCQHSDKLIEKMDLFKDNYKYHIYLITLDIVPNSKNINIVILSEKTDELKFKKMFELKGINKMSFDDEYFDSLETNNLLVDTILNKNLVIIDHLKIIGVPTVYNTNGKNINIRSLF